MKNIRFFKKFNCLTASIVFILAMFIGTSLAAHRYVFAQSDTVSDNDLTQFAVFVSNDGLYMSDLNEDEPVLIEKSKNINKPLISRNGQYVAYIKDEDLFVYNVNTKKIVEVGSNIESYDWNNDGNLIFGEKSRGLSLFDVSLKKKVEIINNNYDYYNIKCNSKNKIYANKKLHEEKDGQQDFKLLGIISYDLNSKEEKVILQGKEGTNKEIGENAKLPEIMESLGSYPCLSKISNDDRYLYIWNKPNSGSVSSDMTEFTVYDLENNKYIENADMVALAYEDNISQNPVDSNYVAVNNGEYRDMYYNKTLGIFNIKDNSFTSIIPENQVSMMPQYSKDGKRILYSGTDTLKDNKFSDLKAWINKPHYIYEVNIDTKKVNKITNSESFDFMPKYLLNNEILFIRKSGDSFSLWKTKDGKETKVADDLKLNSQLYYGHYNTESMIDVFVGK